MPTYVCSVRPGLLSTGQKAAVADAITRIHGEATGAPTYLVQVVIDERAGASRFLSGKPAEDHIWIRGDIRAGRSEAVRRALALDVVRAVAEIAGVAPSDVWVYLCNLAPSDMVEYGHTLPAPGEEQAWFDALPDALRARLSALSAKR